MSLPDVMNFAPSSVPSVVIEDEVNLKKAFGTQLGTGKQAFDAACEVCKNNTSQALYISQHWLNDPIVIAAKEFYIKTVHNAGTLLDANEYAALLLKMANEKNASNTFYILEGKDRLKALELYGKARNFLGSENQINNNVTFKQMVVKFVEPKKEEKIIEQLPDDATQILNNKSNVKLKLVS